MMARNSGLRRREGFKLARLFMVLSSISPLFILWMIRGNQLIADKYFITFCLLMIIAPNVFLWLRIRTAKKLQERSRLSVGKADDHRDHILVYLFAMLLPFYSEDIESWRNFSSVLVALGFIVFLFWHLNLHYMNLVFAMFGYRVFTIYSPDDGNPISGKTSNVLITQRVTLSSGDSLVAYRLSNTVYLEMDA
jgi:hypothetical protein